jgi:hypothetical protein
MPAPIHAFALFGGDDHTPQMIKSRAREGAGGRVHALPVTNSSQAKSMDEPLSDWQVFALLGGSASGFLGLGIAALYGVSLLLN